MSSLIYKLSQGFIYIKKSIEKHVNYRFFSKFFLLTTLNACFIMEIVVLHRKHQIKQNMSKTG